MPNSSLTFRLVATSILWVAGALLACGVILVLLFRDHIERRFDQQLRDHLEELAAAAEIEAGAMKLTWWPSDPRLNRPQSGWYWQIGRQRVPLFRSKSLWNDKLAVPVDTRPAGEPGAARLFALTAPNGEALRAIVEAISLPDATGAFEFIVAGPQHDIEADVARFIWQLATAFGLLALALVAAIPLQVRFGLRPLRDLTGAIATIRAGDMERLPAAVPREVRPVVAELNTLLDHNEALLEKARAQAANLAHALKNPLTVISNEAAGIEGEPGRILTEQTAILRRHVERHLARARAIGAAPSRQARTAVGEVAADLRFSLDLLYRSRHLAIALPENDCVFRGDAHDLEEMLGNLMDNACKWAKARVAVGCTQQGGHLFIHVEDDGPGIAEAHLAGLGERGRRLDERVSGSGLGLDIVGEIADLYGGRLQLNRSPLGGLRATLELPAWTKG